LVEALSLLELNRIASQGWQQDLTQVGGTSFASQQELGNTGAALHAGDQRSTSSLLSTIYLPHPTKGSEGAV